MKLRRAAFIALLATAPPAFAADAGVEFSGVLIADGKVRLALTDLASNTTRWVEPGDVFNGFTVSRYDAEHDAVFLEQNGQETRLGLVPEKIPDASAAGRSTPVLSATRATSAIRANLRQLAAAARRVQAERGVATVSFADLVGPGKPIPQLVPIAGESYSTLTFGPDVRAVSVTTSDGATVSLDLNSVPTPALAATTNAAPTPAQPATAAPVAPATNAASPAATPPTTTAAVPPVSEPAASNIPTPPADPSTAPSTDATAATTTPPAPENTTPTGRPTPAPSYTVQGGDTLDSIALVHGVTPEQLRQLNPALNGSSLRAGDTIRIR